MEKVRLNNSERGIRKKKHRKGTIKKGKKEK
jgi:hypothetical protein